VNLTLQRDNQNAIRTLGVITNDADGSVMVPATLELPWRNNAHGDWTVASCIPAGTYTALRFNSPHIGYVLYQLANVPDRVGVDLHIGNYPHDSEGCILLGESREADAIDSSKEAFDLFMGMLTGIDRFTLTVRDPA
jgi:hypothetical protein